MRLTNIVEFDPEPDEGKVYEGRPRFKGPLAAVAESALAMAFSTRLSNYSVKLEKNMANFDELTGLYDGCLGSIQRNESHAIMASVSFPTQDFERINPVRVISQEPLNIIQGYKPTYRTGYADTLKAALSAFTPGLWMLMFFTLMVFMVTFKLKVSLRNGGKNVIRRKRRAKKDDSTYEVLSLFISEDSFDS